MSLTLFVKVLLHEERDKRKNFGCYKIENDLAMFDRRRKN